MVQAEMEGRRIDRERGQPIRSKLIEDFVLEQNEMRALMDDAAELVLRGAHHRNAQKRHRDVPPPPETGVRN